MSKWPLLVQWEDICNSSESFFHHVHSLCVVEYYRFMNWCSGLQPVGIHTIIALEVGCATGYS